MNNQYPDNKAQLQRYYFSYQTFLIQEMMIKISKNTTKSKAISSYILSGINIKKMIQDQAAISQPNISDVNFIRINNKRHIFKAKQQEKQNTNNISMIGSLPNKSFKIRSYTRKMKQDVMSGGGRSQESELFEKVERLRNYRVNSNRIDLMRVDRQDQNKIQNKIREILHRQASIKCKVSNQVFVKESQPKNIQPNNCQIRYQYLNTERYRQLSHRVNVYFNNQKQEKRKILLIVSLEAIQINSKRILKTSNWCQESHPYKLFISQQQLQALKMLSPKHYNDEVMIWSQVSLAFKVNNSNQLQELRGILQDNHIDDYYCIFYPIKKYVDCFCLYQVDPFLHHNSLIVVESKYNLNHQFPIIGPQIKSCFIVTNQDNLLVITRTISALKAVITHSLKLSPTPSSASIKQKPELFNDSSNLIIDKSFTKGQFNIKQEDIQMSISQLQAKLHFVLGSRELKGWHRASCTQKQGRTNRKILCEKQTNLCLTAGKNGTDDKMSKQLSTDRIKQRLLSSIKEQSACRSLISSIKEVRREQSNQKGGDDVEEITSYVCGGGCRSKTNHQIVAQLIKKNTNIYKLTEEYVKNTSLLNKIVSSTHPNPIDNIPLRITAYKVF